MYSFNAVSIAWREFIEVPLPAPIHTSERDRPLPNLSLDRGYQEWLTSGSGSAMYNRPTGWSKTAQPGYRGICLT
jgi:hypothetical protein